MYERFLADYRRRLPDFPREPSLDLGLGIKQIRLRMGLTQEELARQAGMKPSALKTLENGYARFTKMSNLEAVARVLGVGVREILMEGREWFPGNFYVEKLSEILPTGKRKRKRREEIWYRRVPLLYEGYKLDISSPPLTTPSHFCLAVFEIEPGRKIPGLKLPYPNQVAGLIQRGSLRIAYDSKNETDLVANQGFLLRGDKPHDFINPDKENPVRFWAVFSLEPAKREKKGGGIKARESPVGRAIRRIRHLYSHSKTRPISFVELAYLTGLEAKSLQYLENTTDPDQVVYWDKIERITQALKMPFSKFFDLAEGRDEGYFHRATAHDRALIDYQHYLGIRIKSALFPSPINAYHLSEMTLEPKRGIRRPTWVRRDDARIAVYLEAGELLVEVGKNRKAVLKAGESVYFDASLGYIFTNPSKIHSSKLFTAAYPPIIF